MRAGDAHRTDTRPRLSRQRAMISALGLLLVVFGATVASAPADGASSNVVVSMDVPSAITIADGCSSTAAWNFGVVQPGASATTTTGALVCRISFESSNDSAMLRIAQRDGTGAAMTTPDAATAAASAGLDSAELLAAESYDANLAYFAGNSGRVVRTNDGGATWKTWSVPGGRNLRGIDVEPGTPSEWWLVGDDATVIKATNAQAGDPPTFSATPGTTLLAAGWPAGTTAWGVAVLGPSTVIVTGSNGWMARSTDDGATAGNWTVYQVPIADPTPANHHLHSVAVDPGNPNRIIMADGWNGGRIWYTNNGGINAASWQGANGGYTNVGVYMRSVDISDSSHYYAVGWAGSADNHVFTSADGVTWTARSLGWQSESKFNDISSPASSPATAVVFGDHGSSWRTTDGGVTWARERTPVSMELLGGEVASASVAFATGASEAVMRTVDSGTTWEVRSRKAGSYGLSDIEVAPGNGRQWIAVGGEGVIRRSTDGGGTWAVIASGTSTSLRSVSFGSDTTGWVVGESGTILKTTDGGSSWSAQTSGTSSLLVSVLATSPSTAFATGPAGLILRTRNGGASWTQLSTGATTIITDIARSGSGTLVAVGSNNTVLRSTDDGTTWNVIAPGTLPETTRVVQSVTSGRSGVFFAITKWGSIWKSTDDGLTWSTVASYPRVGAYHYAIDALGDTISTGGNPEISAYSTDGGATWTQTNNAVWVSLRDVEVIDPSRIIHATGHSGYRYTTPSVAKTISDYGGANTFGNPAAGTSLFGTCVQAVGGAAVIAAGWTVDANATCTASDADPWAAIPTALTKLATVPGGGGTGSVDMVWGVRTRETQQTGSYFAGIVFEALAPNI